MHVPGAHVLGTEAPLLSRRDKNRAQWFYMELMFFLRGHDDGDRDDNDDDSSHLLHVYYMPHTALGDWLWQPSKKVIISTTSRTGSLKLRAET